MLWKEPFDWAEVLHAPVGALGGTPEVIAVRQRRGWKRGISLLLLRWWQQTSSRWQRGCSFLDPGISSDIIAVTCSFFSKKVQAKCQERASRGSDQLECDAVIDVKADFLGFNATYFALFTDWFGMLMGVAKVYSPNGWWNGSSSVLAGPDWVTVS